MKITPFKKFLIKSAVAAVVILPILTFFHFFLPRIAIMEVGVPYVRRMDNDHNRVGQTDVTHGDTRDVFFIPFYEPGSGATFVMRNEDTSWGWPWYFKFNSADINGDASKLSQNKAIVKVRYYGFRIEMFSIFPNVLSITPAKVDDNAIPVGRIVFFIMIVALVGYIRWKFRAFFARFKRKTGA